MGTEAGRMAWRGSWTLVKGRAVKVGQLVTEKARSRGVWKRIEIIRIAP